MWFVFKTFRCPLILPDRPNFTAIRPVNLYALTAQISLHSVLYRVVDAPDFKQLNLEALLAERWVTEGVTVLRTPTMQIPINIQSLPSTAPYDDPLSASSHEHGGCFGGQVWHGAEVSWPGLCMGHG